MANGLPPPSIKIGECLLQFEEEELGEEFEERARKELRETPKVVGDALVALKDLIRSKELTFLSVGYLRFCSSALLLCGKFMFGLVFFVFEFLGNFLFQATFSCACKLIKNSKSL
jgi:hypothetical protein